MDRFIALSSHWFYTLELEHLVSVEGPASFPSAAPFLQSEGSPQPRPTFSIAPQYAKRLTSIMVLALSELLASTFPRVRGTKWLQYRNGEEDLLGMFHRARPDRRL